MAGRPFMRIVNLNMGLAGLQIIWERADVAMRRDHITHVLFHDVFRADSHNLWKNTFEKTNDGHCIF